MGSLLRISFATVALVACLVAGLPATPAEATPELVALINQYRASRGLAPLATSAPLASAAQWMATSMATNNYFSHTSIDGRSPQQRMAAFGYPAFSTWTGEDLAAGQATASAVLAQWQASPTHNAVLLSANARAIGTAVAYGASSTYKWYWVADFGGIAAGAAPAPAPAPVARGGAPSPVARGAPAGYVAAGDVAPDHGLHARFARQSPTLVVLRPRQIARFVVAFENAGSRAWVLGTATEARLGTSAPLDRRYPELEWGWLAPTRPAVQTTEEVPPGALGWFDFMVRAPRGIGVYDLDVRAVVDGETWLEDAGVRWTLVVPCEAPARVCALLE